MIDDTLQKQHTLIEAGWAVSSQLLPSGRWAACAERVTGHLACHDETVIIGEEVARIYAFGATQEMVIERLAAAVEMERGVQTNTTRG